MAKAKAKKKSGAKKESANAAAASAAGNGGSVGNGNGGNGNGNGNGRPRSRRFRTATLAMVAIIAGAAVFILSNADAGNGLTFHHATGAQAPLGYVIFGVGILAAIHLLGRGAAWFVDASVRMANVFKIPHVVIGLTVVAFGTSAPEFAVSIMAAATDKGDISIANVVGSNIFNLGFILGSVALLSPIGIPVARKVVFRDGAALIGATLILFAFLGSFNFGMMFGSHAFKPSKVVGDSSFGLLDFHLGMVEAVIMLIVLSAYMITLLVLREKRRTQVDPEFGLVTKLHLKKRPGKMSDTEMKRREKELLKDAAIADASESIGDEEISEDKATWVDIPLWFISLAMIIAGGHLLVESAVWYAASFGVPDWIVGVTIVAAGTSAPEFAVSIVAALKKRFEISAGNLIGSDIFNILGVLGVAGIINANGISISPVSLGSMIALIGMVTITVIFMWTGNRVSRLEGGILLLIAIGRWVFDFAQTVPAAGHAVTQ